MTITIRPATTSDQRVICRWRREAAAWLASKGSDQWSDAGLTMDTFAARVEASIRAGETWIAEVEGQPRGTIAVDEHSDPGLWSAAELAESVIVHRMITDRGHPVPGLGAVLLGVADAVAQARGKRWVRLDAWTSNRGLHDYYRHQGFELVRMVTDRPSGALFQRPVPLPQGYDTPGRTDQFVATTEIV